MFREKEVIKPRDNATLWSSSICVGVCVCVSTRAVVDYLQVSSRDADKRFIRAVNFRVVFPTVHRFGTGCNGAIVMIFRAAQSL